MCMCMNQYLCVCENGVCGKGAWGYEQSRRVVQGFGNSEHKSDGADETGGTKWGKDRGVGVG